jgi:hypothetical protein
MFAHTNASLYPFAVTAWCCSANVAGQADSSRITWWRGQ